MLSLAIVLFVFVVIAVLVAFIAGLITISPLLICIIALPVLDIMVFKAIFKKKKKK